MTPLRQRMTEGQVCGGIEAGLCGEKTAFLRDSQTLADTEAFGAFVDELSAQDWVVYSKPPFGGAEQSCNISPPTRIGWPSLTIESSPSMTLM
jgi:hypothetical protein